MHRTHRHTSTSTARALNQLTDSPLLQQYRLLLNTLCMALADQKIVRMNNKKGKAGQLMVAPVHDPLTLRRQRSWPSVKQHQTHIRLPNLLPPPQRNPQTDRVV